MPTARIEGLTTERFAHILSVALDEFARYRYGEASFNRIIKNCGMAKGTMYYYFKSKEDLFLTIHRATIKDFKRLVSLSFEPPLSELSFWQVAEDLLLEFYRTIYRKPTASQFVTNFLTSESRREGHPAIATVNAIDAWLKEFLTQGRELGAIRSDLTIDQLAVLAWGIWESCRSWLPSETNKMQAIVHPDVILDLFRRTLLPITVEKAATETAGIAPDDPFAGNDEADPDSAFMGAPEEALSAGEEEA